MFVYLMYNLQLKQLFLEPTQRLIIQKPHNLILI